MRSWARWILAAALVIHAIAFSVSAVRSSEPAGDFDRYYEIASAPGRPYVDYQVEHPIATLLVFRILGQPPATRASFGLGIVVVNLVADAVIVGSLPPEFGSILPAMPLDTPVTRPS